MLKIATHNRYKGGASDNSAWARDIATLDPNILLLQESREQTGYLDKIPSEQHAQVKEALWVEVENIKWGSAIYLKQGHSIPNHEVPPTLQGWVVGAQITDLAWLPSSTRSLYVFSIHTPTRTSKNYEGAVIEILDHIAPYTKSHDVVIGGDFNVTISARHPSEEKRNTAGELAIHQRLRDELGLINCWHTLHPDEALAQTYRHQFSNEPQSFYLDGLFVPATWRPLLRSCEVFNGPEWRGNTDSDHFAMMATFAP